MMVIFPLSIVAQDKRIAMRLKSLTRGLIVGLFSVGILINASLLATTAAQADTDFAATLSGNYLAALVAGMSNDPGSASRYYSESIKFDPRSADLAERTFVTLLAEGKMTEAGYASLPLDVKG